MFKNKKRVIALIMAALLAASAVGTSIAFIPSNTGIVAEAETTEDGFVYDVNEDRTVTITKYSGQDENVEIPSKIDDKDVTAIGYNAFYNCTSLTGVTIPNSVKSIDGAAFYNCTSLTSIIIPNSVKSIGGYAFYGCSNLTDITLPDSITNIELDAFYGSGYYLDSGNWENGALYINNCLIDFDTEQSGSYTVKEDTKFIANYAFNWCEKLTSITIPEGVTNIGGMAFAYCSELTSLTIPSSVINIGDYPFSSSDKLKEINYSGTTDQWKNYDVEFFGNVVCSDGTLTYIGGECGDNLKWRLEENTLTITGTGKMYDWEIDKDAPWYSYKEQIQKIVVSEGATSIGNNAFNGYYNTKSIELPDGITSIGDAAFIACAVKSISIPNSVTYLGTSAFQACTSLENIKIPDGITEINNYVCMACEKLNSVTLPNGIKSIGRYAFDRCYNLPEINIPESVTSIAEGAFSDCKSLKEIKIPSKVTTISDATFYGCTGLESFSIPENITSVGEEAFSCCTNLKSINIPSSVKVLGSNAFYKCESLDNIVIPNSITTLSMGLFSDCKSLKNVTIPDSVTSIEMGAFQFCESLKNIKLPSGLTSISDGLFYKCAALESIEIPDGVTSINEAAFVFCTSLKSIEIPNSVKTIGMGAFYGCNELNTVTLGNNITSIGQLAFISAKPSDTVVQNEDSNTDVKNYNIVNFHGTEDEWNDLITNKTHPDNYSLINTTEKKYNYHPNNGKYQSDNEKHWLVCEYGGEIINAEKHKWDEGKIVQPGKKVYTCTVCSHTKTEKVAVDYTLTFNTNSGTAIAPITKTEGTVINLNSYKPTRSGYSFAGWYSDAKLTKKVTSVTLNANTTVYAKWNASELESTSISTILNSEYGIKFTWNKVANADGYKIYRKTNDKWEVIAVVKGADTTHYLDKKVLNGTRYTYAVRAYNDAGMSDYTTKTVIRMVAPQLISATNTTNGSVNVSWYHNSQASGYVVSYSTGGVTKYVRTYGVASNTATLKNLQKGKTYEIQVRAYKTIGQTMSYSDWSQPKYVTIKK